VTWQVNYYKKSFILLFILNLLVCFTSFAFAQEKGITQEAIIGNKESLLYHKANSHHLPPLDKRVYFSSLDEAEAAGYKPCKICFPPSDITDPDYDLEQMLGQETAGAIEYYYRVLRDPVITAKVQKIGELLVSNSDRPNINYVFTVLNTDDINAIAAPAGYVYITKGMLDVLESDGEIAAVLAHEIAHITEKHGLKEYKKASGFANLATLIQIIFGRSSAGAANTASILSEFAYSLILNGYSRAYEREADEVAMYLLEKSGFSIDNFFVVLNKLQDLEEITPPGGLSFFRSHPPVAERLELAKRYLNRQIIVLLASEEKDGFIFSLKRIKYQNNNEVILEASIENISHNEPVYLTDIKLLSATDDKGRITEGVVNFGKLGESAKKDKIFELKSYKEGTVTFKNFNPYATFYNFRFNVNLYSQQQKQEEVLEFNFLVQGPFNPKS